jgi:hypothetical protein
MSESIEPRRRARVLGCVAAGALYLVVMLAALVGLFVWLLSRFN